MKINKYEIQCFQKQAYILQCLLTSTGQRMQRIEINLSKKFHLKKGKQKRLKCSCCANTLTRNINKSNAFSLPEFIALFIESNYSKSIVTWLT